MDNEENKEAAKPIRRVRIVNEGGAGYATKITDAETGQHIDRIFHIRLIDLDVKEVPTAILWSYMPAVDIIADAEVVDCCMYCGQQKPKQSDAFQLRTKINDIDVDVSIEKLQRLQELQRATSTSNNVYPAEALTAFVTWLRKEKTGLFLAPMSGQRLSELAQLFYEAQGWHFDKEYYDEIIDEIERNYPE